MVEKIMRILFKFTVVDIPPAHVGHKVKFVSDIEEFYPGLRGWGNKVYEIIDEDRERNLFKLSRGVWISRTVIDPRYAKLISKYRQL